MLDEAGRPMIESIPRERPLVKLHHAFNVERTEGLERISRQPRRGAQHRSRLRLVIAAIPAARDLVALWESDLELAGRDAGSILIITSPPVST